jgi:hypothetical protein
MRAEDVAEELAGRLRMVSQLQQVHIVPPGQIVTPAAVVTFPQRVDFDLSGDRGTDSMLIPVLVMTAKVGGSQNAWGVLSDFLNGSGAPSIKAAIEADYAPAPGVFDYAHVESETTDVTRWGGTDYLTLSFDVTVVGSGTA